MSRNRVTYTYGSKNTAAAGDAGPYAVTSMGSEKLFWYDNNGNQPDARILPNPASFQIFQVSLQLIVTGAYMPDDKPQAVHSLCSVVQ